jgi:hypothetical protein
MYYYFVVKYQPVEPSTPEERAFSEADNIFMASIINVLADNIMVN